ncbi:MAG TPA: hypothetical protein VMU36_13620 [Spirochaetia bacterium]|nr:hypothetical protein [Spirochaetia bacterium]
MLLVLPCHAAAAADSRDYLPRLRQLFYVAANDESAVLRAMSFLQQTFPTSPDLWPPVAQAYYGALEGLRAKYSNGLFDKLYHLQKAISTLRELPEKNPESLEILFLRFSLFHQVPSFFGVRSTVSPDLERLIVILEAHLDEQVPVDIQRAMATYLRACGEADRFQAARLEEVLRRTASLS